MEERPSRRSDNRLLRWAIVAAILGAAVVVATFLILRALPSEAEVAIEIGGWRVPVGVVVSTDDAKSQLPGLVVDAILGREATIQINAGRVAQSGPDELTIEPLSGQERISFELTDRTRILSARLFNIGSALNARELNEGELVAVMTIPGRTEAFLVLTGITRATD